MKIHVNPLKSTVISILKERRDLEEKVLQTDQTELETLTNGTLKVIRPGQDVGLKHLIRQRETYIAQVDAQLRMVQNHPDETIHTEIDL